MTDITQRVDGLVHEPSQTGGPGVDLTVEYVARLDGRGEIDFGGDEYDRPATEAVGTERRSADDDYGWWELDEGTYVVRYNESLADDAGPVALQPHPRLLALGVTHPTVRVESLPRVPLTVPDGGVAIKENARISQLLAAPAGRRSP